MSFGDELEAARSIERDRGHVADRALARGGLDEFAERKLEPTWRIGTDIGAHSFAIAEMRTA